MRSERLGNIEPSGIWLVDADGGGLVPVTENYGVNVSPQWLPDGRHLLFISNRDVRSISDRSDGVLETRVTGPRVGVVTLFVTIPEETSKFLLGKNLA